MSKVWRKVPRINGETMKEIEEEITSEICECEHPGTAHIEYGHGRCQRKGCKCEKFKEQRE